MCMHMVNLPFRMTTTPKGGGTSEVFLHTHVEDHAVHLQLMSLFPQVVEVILVVGSE